jgi:hypothetical protein
MMTRPRLLLSLALSLPLAVAASAPVQAGFWEDLFGVNEKPAAAPAPQRNAPRVAAPSGAAKAVKKKSEHSGIAKRERKDAVAINLALKAAQAGKDPAMLALQDNTLRRGDVVSGPDGLMVYMGEAKFVPANDPNLAKTLRQSLQGLKRPVATAAPEAQKPAAQDRTPEAVAQTVSIERDGKLIRVIGAYQGSN